MVILEQNDDQTWFGLIRPGKNIKEVKRITAISGNTITVDPPVSWTNWSPTFSPTVSSFGDPSYQSIGIGLESFKMDSSSSTGAFGIFIEQSYGCWVENVWSYMCYGYHTVVYNSSRLEFRRVRWWDSQIHAQNCGGLVFQQSVSNSLIEDNIFYRQCPGVECDAASSGNAFLYNFSARPSGPRARPVQEYSFDSNHAPHGDMNLYEGNYGNNFINDGYHGSGSHFTIFEIGSTATTKPETPSIRVVLTCAVGASTTRWSATSSVHPAFLMFSMRKPMASVEY